jgi:hypothetical protein
MCRCPSTLMLQQTLSIWNQVKQIFQFIILFFVYVIINDGICLEILSTVIFTYIITSVFVDQSFVRTILFYNMFDVEFNGKKIMIDIVHVYDVCRARSRRSIMKHCWYHVYSYVRLNRWSTIEIKRLNWIDSKYAMSNKIIDESLFEWSWAHANEHLYAVRIVFTVVNQTNRQQVSLCA